MFGKRGTEMIKKISTRTEYLVGTEYITIWYLFGFPVWKLTDIRLTNSPLPRQKDGLDSQYSHMFQKTIL